jgi:hypothetical protein
VVLVAMERHPTAQSSKKEWSPDNKKHTCNEVEVEAMIGRGHQTQQSSEQG